MIRTLSALAVAALATTALPQVASAQVVQAGVLRCTAAAGSGWVLGSQKRVACVWRNPYGEIEHYDGVASTLGIDIGYTSISSMAWGVIAPAGNVRGGLSGNFGGVGLQATVAVGVGANAMIGGFQNQFMLQPLSVTGQEGLNGQVGLTGLSLALRTVTPPRRHR
ncbi:DUF992 domain-containing protein [Enterovirga rhinocerotis]|uniref:Uncharacterized protein DUF992 n=1 Tax=Enterovirga rhinocerotis TaxID=1339210 RepID=A0A4R7C8V9_9HYPH|nr:DUF992 domain-containing protein [Enterovirga rhinocerotis]TDR94831.1 uncharacterized protein DUF992 [Enterovirga rhinocerotis]